jgi:D-3-phosphoglycerate dehydrogenase
VINTPQANANAVAEHIFGMLLGLLRNILIADTEVRKGIWNREKNRGTELRGKTVGIIGYGNNGSAFASKFSGWGVTVLAYDKYKTGFAEGSAFIREVTLEKLLEKSEIVSLHVPLTQETRQMVDAQFLSQCKSGAILINSSRGRVVNTNALIAALESGWISGACLDVFENERPETYDRVEAQMYATLAGFPNVVLTPHIAGWTFESKLQIAGQILHEVSRL